MPAEVHYFYSPPPPIGHFLRVGHNGHRQLETLFERGRLGTDRIAIEACRFEEQQDLVSALWTQGREIVLDPNVAELSSSGRYQGACREFAWANQSGPLAPDDFQGERHQRIARLIADFAVERKVDTVLAPTHFLEGARDEWLSIDVKSVRLLRMALTDVGGRDIAIEYREFEKVLQRTALRLDRMRGVLEDDLDRTLGEGSRSAPVLTRQAVQSRRQARG